MTIAIGIDLSTSSTGFAFIGPDIQPYVSTIKGDPKKSGMDKHHTMVSRIMERIHAVKHDIIVIEGYSLNMKNASSVVPLVELGGLLRFMLYLDGIPWCDPRASELKKFVTGKGNTKKEHMMMHVLKRWGVTTNNADEADAYGLACMGLARLRALPVTKEMQKIASEMEFRTA